MAYRADYIRIDGRDYIEDRRPNASCDPFVTPRLIIDTCCSALAS